MKVSVMLQGLIELFDGLETVAAAKGERQSQQLSGIEGTVFLEMELSVKHNIELGQVQHSLALCFLRTPPLFCDGFLELATNAVF